MGNCVSLHIFSFLLKCWGKIKELMWKKKKSYEKLVGNNMEVVTVIDRDNGITKQVGAL